jgi:hypothetical protein
MRRNGISYVLFGDAWLLLLIKQFQPSRMTMCDLLVNGVCCDAILHLMGQNWGEWDDSVVG